MNHMLPLIPGINVHHDRPGMKTLSKWVHDYDEGFYDDVLALYREKRIEVQDGVTFYSGLNSAVFNRLLSLNVDELDQCTPNQCFVFLDAARKDLGEPQVKRSKRWVYDIIRRAKNFRWGGARKRRRKKNQDCCCFSR